MIFPRESLLILVDVKSKFKNLTENKKQGEMFAWNYKTNSYYAAKQSKNIIQNKTN